MQKVTSSVAKSGASHGTRRSTTWGAGRVRTATALLVRNGRFYRFRKVDAALEQRQLFAGKGCSFESRKWRGSLQREHQKTPRRHFLRQPIAAGKRPLMGGHQHVHALDFALRNGPLVIVLEQH